MLDEDVQVWVVRPHRIRVGTEVTWLGLKADGTTALYATWSISDCLINCRTYPDSDIQCIRNGDEPAEAEALLA